MACDQFPDIYEHTPKSASDTTKDAIGKRNEARQALYTAVRYLLIKRFNYADKLPQKTQDLEEHGSDPQFPFLITIFGMLLSDSRVDPSMGKMVFGSEDITDVDDHQTRINIARRFVDEVVQRVSEYQAAESLFTNVYKNLRELGVSSTSSNGQPAAAAAAAAAAARPPNVTVFAKQLAEVSRRLVEEGAFANDPQLKVRVTALLSVVLGDSVSGRASAIGVDLPDLEETTQATILKDNVSSLAAVYFCAMLEDYKVFDVANVVADQFMQGVLPLSRGPGGNAIYEYIRETPNRFTAVERRTIYAQSLGLAQGSIDVQLPNREFSDLWIRFLSAASLSGRQNALSNTRLVTTGAYVTAEQVFKSAKDLAVNLSLHGYGIGYFAAIELQQLIKNVKAMLSYPDVIAAYGVRDVWQLVERVSQMYLGGSVNGVRQRTMAHHGAKIIEFLSDNAGILSGPVVGLDLTSINSNIEQWLAVTGTDDNVVDKYSAPVSVTQQPTIPMTFGSSQGDLMRTALQQVGGIAPNLLPSLSGNAVSNMAKA
jgi:hypothetical protein